LLNDCKYGHDIQGNVIRLSLLRSPTVPDPEADQGDHHFTYSLYPHTGGWDENTQREAYALNDPLIVYQPTRSTQQATHCPSFLTCDAANIVIETIKRAEDGRGFIVRLYESQRRRGEVVLTTAFDLAEVWRCNLLEENQSEVEAEVRRVVLAVKPYEIITLRLIPANN
jgi:alpha-mannosidase